MDVMLIYYPAYFITRILYKAYYINLFRISNTYDVPEWSIIAMLERWATLYSSVT